MGQHETIKYLPDSGPYVYYSKKIVEDAEGKQLQLSVLDDRTLTPLGEKFYRQIKGIPLRDDDVLLCGYPKTGCHWTWEVMQMILGVETQCSAEGKYNTFLEMQQADVIESLTSPRVLNTHVWFDSLPEQLFLKKTKIVLTTRNPKDVAVSFYNHHINLPLYGYNGSFKGWFPLYVDGNVDYGQFADYYLSWDEAIRNNPDHPIYVVSYEDMKKDPSREIRGLCKFLGVELTEGQVDEIARSTGFDAMKNAFSDGCKPLLRKGRVGDWKNWLTVAQSELIDDVMGKKLAHTSFRFRYTI